MAAARHPPAARHRILVVDHEARVRQALAACLHAEGYAVVSAAAGTAALELIALERPDFVLAELHMPGMDGMQLLERIQQRWPELPVAILTAHSEVPEALAATRAGAADFLTQPLERQHLLDCIRRHLETIPGAAAFELEPELATRNPALQTQLAAAARAARTDAAVLITGAAGTGKEMLARAIHRASARALRPFVAVNCAGPAAQLAAELFGTGPGGLPGQVHAADRGTLFLQQVGQLPPELQTRLLRLLQEHQLRPAGAPADAAPDLRVIAAGREGLDELVAAGRFREDLYYCLNVVAVHLPALSERREDIPALVNRKLAELAAAGAPRRSFSVEAMELLAAAAWPGNVRQLFGLVERNAALAPGRVVGAAQVRHALGDPPATLPSFDQARSEFSRNYLSQMLKLAGGNVSRAARLAGRNRTDFYKLLRRHGVLAGSFKDQRGN